MQTMQPSAAMETIQRALDTLYEIRHATPGDRSAAADCALGEMIGSATMLLHHDLARIESLLQDLQSHPQRRNMEVVQPANTIVEPLPYHDGP